MINKIKQFFQKKIKSISTFIHRPKRKELLSEIKSLKETLKMYERSQNFVRTNYLDKYSFNVAVPQYEKGSPYYKNIVIDLLSNKIASFIRENKCYQVYKNCEPTDGRYLPLDRADVYHTEFWFERKGKMPNVFDYTQRQHYNSYGFNLDCEKEV